MEWGAEGSRGAIVTGSQEGILRRWSMAGNLSQEGQTLKLRRQIQKVIPNDNDIIVASGEDIVFVNEEFQTIRTVGMPFRVSDMFIVNTSTLVVCGPGSIAHVKSAQGVYTQLVTPSSVNNYTCVTHLADEIVCVGTEEGKLFAIDFNSGEELGVLDVGFPLPSMLPYQHRIVTSLNALEPERPINCICNLAAATEVTHRSFRVTVRGPMVINPIQRRLRVRRRLLR